LVSRLLLLRYFKSRRRVGEPEDNYSVFARIQLQFFAPFHPTDLQLNPRPDPTHGANGENAEKQGLT
jgi:hypothetical protein